MGKESVQTKIMGHDKLIAEDLIAWFRTKNILHWLALEISRTAVLCNMCHVTEHQKMMHIEESTK